MTLFRLVLAVAIGNGLAAEPSTDAATQAARRLFLENAVCAADLDRALAAARKHRVGRLDGTTLYHRRMSREKAEAELRRAEKNLRAEFPVPAFDRSRCGTDVQAARVVSRKPIPSPDTPENAREWASVMPEPTVAALLCLRHRAPATGTGSASSSAAVTAALESVYAARFGGAFATVKAARCALP